MSKINRTVRSISKPRATPKPCKTLLPGAGRALVLPRSARANHLRARQKIIPGLKFACDMIFLVEFIFCDYSAGLTLCRHRWLFLMRWTVHYFSLPLLLPTLFFPWKRLVDDPPHVRFPPDIFFPHLT